MRIVTYNLRKGGARRVHWSHVFDQLAPDIFLAQESYSPDEHLPPLIHGQAASRAVWQGVAGQRWGSAVYCRAGSIRRMELSAFAGNVVGVAIEGLPILGGSKLLVFSVHAPSPYQRSVHAILDSIARMKFAANLVIGGDFNLTVSESHGSEARPTRAMDLAIQHRLRDEFGLMNCWQAANPGVPLPQTLRWSADGGKTPYHCDGIFVPENWAVRLAGCSVVSGGAWDAMSDHNPVVADFQPD